MKYLAHKLLLLIALAVAPLLAAAQNFGFEPPAQATDPALPAALRDLAQRILPVYQEGDTERYLLNLAALQMAVGDPAAAHATRRKLLERQQSAAGDASIPSARVVVYDMYTRARANEVQESKPFASAYGDAFRDTLNDLDDLDVDDLEEWLIAPLEPLQEDLQRLLDQRAGKNSIALEEALDLMQAWFLFEANRSFGGLARPLVAEQNARRYTEDAVAIPVGNGATIAARVVRSQRRADAGPRPTVLEFTLDRASRNPQVAAAHGYVSVLALARIAGDPEHRPRQPFETDGDDARAVIEWIAQQPWSDGRVVMQGHGYGGFVAWAAAKRPPAALKAIATSDPMAPGIDMPMSNRIMQNSAYRWLYALLAPPGDDVANDAARWRSIDEDWFRSGRAYREFPALPGPATAVFKDWLLHPSYDRFWQKWLPFGAEFAAIDIPVLTVTGYYSAGETAALYYFTQHHSHDPEANHALLIGPFDDQSIEHGASSRVRDLALDPVAVMDPNDARYEWFDYALAESAERPALLSANVNYQLMGANEWRHEPSLEALDSAALRFYFAAGGDETAQALVAEQPAASTSIAQTFDLRDRSDVEWRPARELVLTDLRLRESKLFVTQPFDADVDVAGQLRGVLDFTINKHDVDFVMTLYELRSNGEYVKLFEPAYAFRASYARDRTRRRLLMSGVRQQLAFQSERMVGGRLQAGSRLVLALGVNKRADQQINYGAGGAVSEESLEPHADVEIRIRWHDGTFIEIPKR